MAPVNAAKMTLPSTTPALTMPVPTVCATWSPNTAKAMKLKNAAQITAVCGRSTRVATTVAIELAASWRPFRKSNSSATAINATRIGESERRGVHASSDPICAPLMAHPACAPR